MNTDQTSVPYEGRPLRIGRTTYVVPALSVRQVKKHRATLANAAAINGREPSDEEVDAMVGVVVDALRRNYPTLDAEAFQDELDMRSLPEALRAVVAQTGLEERQPGEGVGR